MRIKIAVCDGDKEVCCYIAEIISRQKPEVFVKAYLHYAKRGGIVNV